jgi:hypothetical protein
MLDGIGSKFVPARPGEWRDVPSPAPAKLHPSESASSKSVGAGDVGRFGDLGRLYEARGREWAEAVRIRQLDRRLSKIDERIGALLEELNQVKLYPPYPADEPRRAAAIRQFNGVAAEVARLAPERQLSKLPDNASTEVATAALERLQQTRLAVEQRRQELVVRFAADDPAEKEAERQSEDARTQLGDTPEQGLTRTTSDLLRQLS